MSKRRSHRNRSGWSLNSLSRKQKQAVIVLACCLLAILITSLVVGVMVSGFSSRGSGDSSSINSGSSGSTSYDNSEFAIDETSSAILAETQDGGDAYVEQTVFVGDSNTVRFNQYNLLTLDQFVGKESMGIQEVPTTKCVYFKNDNTAYTIPEALAKMKPRRIVMTFGTNNADGSMSAEAFIESYRTAIKAIQDAYSYCDIIINAIPPVGVSTSGYHVDMQTVDELNYALVKMCEEDGLKFLNTSEVLKGDDGYARAEYMSSDGIHLSQSGLKKILEYHRTHVYETEDRRPDTNNIPKRAKNPVETGTTTPTSSSATPEPKDYTANYYTENSGGTLSYGDKTGQGSVSVSVSASDSVTVTAVPAEGYVFLKWSDGVTTAARTDKNFKQNLSVTAMFMKLSVSATKTTVTTGEEVTLTATVSRGDKYAADVKWSGTGVDGATGANCKFSSTSPGDYVIKASVTVDGVTAETTITIKVEAATPAPTASPTTAPTATPTTAPPTAPTTTPTATPTATAEPTPTATPEPAPTATPEPAPTATPEPAATETPAAENAAPSGSSGESGVTE